jgi:hypothetical protein
MNFEEFSSKKITVLMAWNSHGTNHAKTITQNPMGVKRPRRIFL